MLQTWEIDYILNYMNSLQPLVWVSAGAQCACAVPAASASPVVATSEQVGNVGVWLWTCSSSKCFPAPDAGAGLLTLTVTANHELPAWSIRAESDLSVKSTGGDRDVLFTEESCILQVQVKAYLLDPHPRLNRVASWWLMTSSSLELE